jgi:hypothetical protein
MAFLILFRFNILRGGFEENVKGGLEMRGVELFKNFRFISF